VFASRHCDGESANPEGGVVSRFGGGRKKVH